MSAINNVVAIQRGTVYEDIQTYLGSLDSNNTVENYSGAIKRFFMYTRNKQIENLVESDLTFRNADLERYKQHLKECGLSASTINVQMSAIYGLFKFLEKNDYNVSSEKIKVKRLKVINNSYGELTEDVAKEMVERVKKQKKGVEKAALIRLAYKTSIRESALLSLEWSDIKKADGQNYYLVRTIDKGEKEDFKPITESVYNELLEIKKQKYYKQYTDNKIFHLSKNTICAMMESLRKEMGLDENIKFHSLKNIGVNHMAQEEGIIAAAIQGNHSNINTTYNHYISKKRDYESMYGLISEDNIPDNIVDELTRDELLELVKMRKNGMWLQVKRDAKKIIEKRGESVN